MKNPPQHLRRPSSNSSVLVQLSPRQFTLVPGYWSASSSPVVSDTLAELSATTDFSVPGVHDGNSIRLRVQSTSHIPHLQSLPQLIRNHLTHSRDPLRKPSTPCRPSSRQNLQANAKKRLSQQTEAFHPVRGRERAQRSPTGKSNATDFRQSRV